MIPTKLTSLELFDLAAELVKVIIKLFSRHIHDVVVNSLERVDSIFKICKYLLDAGCQGLALCSTDLDLAQLAELHDGRGKVEDVVALMKVKL